MTGKKLAGLLVEAENDGRSGVVSATRGKLKRLFCVSNGRLRWAVSNVIEEQLGETLVSTGTVSSDALSSVAADARSGNGAVTSLIVERRIAPRPAVEAALEEHVRRLVLDTLHWQDGEFSFQTGIPNLGNELTVELPCAMLLLDLLRGDDSATTVRGRDDLSRPGIHLCRAGGLDRTMFELRQDAVCDRLLDACREGAPAATIVNAAEVDPDQAWRTLHALVCCGLIVTRTAAAQAVGGPVTRVEVLARIERGRDADHYGVLELASTATSDDVRQAYYFLARRYHPDRFRAGALADLLDQIEVYFTRVTEAYNTLFDLELRAAYDEVRVTAGPAKSDQQDTAELALQNYVKARGAMERGRYAEAANWLENAVKLAADDARYRLELGRLLTRNPRRRPDAKDHLLQAARIDPANPDTYLALGELCEKMLLPDEAAEHYREVLRWEPGHLAAADALQQLGKG